MRNVLFVFIAMVFAGLGVSPAVAAGSQCCLRDGQVWWADQSTCYRQGGTPTANDYCRRGSVGGQYDDGYGYGYGYNDPYGNPDRRVCCSSNYGIGWASWRQCRYARGQDVKNKVCRRTHGIDYNRIFGGYDNGGGYGWGQDPYNNPNRRVCCKRGYQDWWSTARECRQYGGYETANRECRND